MLIIAELQLFVTTTRGDALSFKQFEIHYPPIDQLLFVF